jgi:hypothetical protein
MHYRYLHQVTERARAVAMRDGATTAAEVQLRSHLGALNLEAALRLVCVSI